MKIEIVPGRCMGSGNCAFHAPGTFDLGDDLLVVVIDPAGDDDEAIARAAEGCPTNAIVATSE